MTKAKLGAPLSPAELKCLELVAKDLSNKGIARELNLSLHTVRNRLTQVFAKIGVKSRVGAAVKFVKEMENEQHF